MTNILFHCIQIVLEGRSLVEAVCSCKAGNALCNHSIALLFQTAAYSAQNLAAVPPVLNCTETEL